MEINYECKFNSKNYFYVLSILNIYINNLFSLFEYINCLMNY